MALRHTSFNGADVFQRRRQRWKVTSSSWKSLASMEPTSFNVGDINCLCPKCTRRRSFNGADVFQRRRRGSGRLGDDSWDAASMEPTSFNVGDLVSRSLSLSSGQKLQWSRRLSTSETHNYHGG